MKLVAQILFATVIGSEAWVNHFSSSRSQISKLQAANDFNVVLRPSSNPDGKWTMIKNYKRDPLKSLGEVRRIAKRVFIFKIYIQYVQHSTVQKLVQQGFIDMLGTQMMGLNTSCGIMVVV
jgi:hypothetical protein